MNDFTCNLAVPAVLRRVLGWWRVGRRAVRAGCDDSKHGITGTIEASSPRSSADATIRFKQVFFRISCARSASSDNSSAEQEQEEPSGLESRIMTQSLSLKFGTTSSMKCSKLIRCNGESDEISPALLARPTLALGLAVAWGISVFNPSGLAVAWGISVFNPSVVSL